MNEPECLMEAIRYRRDFYWKLQELYNLLYDILKDYEVINTADSKAASFYELLEKINNIETYSSETLNIDPEYYYRRMDDMGTPNNIKFLHADVQMGYGNANPHWQYMKNTFSCKSYFNHVVWAKILSYKYFLEEFLKIKGIDENELKKIAYNYDLNSYIEYPLTLKELIELLRNLPVWENTEIKITSAKYEDEKILVYEQQSNNFAFEVNGKNNKKIEGAEVFFYEITDNNTSCQVTNTDILIDSGIDTIQFTPSVITGLYQDKKYKLIFKGFDNYRSSCKIIDVRIRQHPYIIEASVTNGTPTSEYYSTVEDQLPEVIITEETDHLIKGFIENIKENDEFYIEATSNNELIVHKIDFYDGNKFFFRHDEIFDTFTEDFKPEIQFTFKIICNNIKIYPHPFYFVDYISDVTINDDLIVTKNYLKDLRWNDPVTDLTINNNADLVMTTEAFTRTSSLTDILSRIYIPIDENDIIKEKVSEQAQLVMHTNSTEGNIEDEWEIKIKVKDINGNPITNLPVDMFVEGEQVEFNPPLTTDNEGKIYRKYIFNNYGGITISFATRDQNEYKNAQTNCYIYIHNEEEEAYIYNEEEEEADDLL